MAVGDLSERTLEYTPTWALATVSAVFIIVSVIVKRGLHALGHYLHRTEKKPLLLALNKMKDELMLVGFISLAIGIFTTPVSKICIKSTVYVKSNWNPCVGSSMPKAEDVSSSYPPPGEGRRKLLATPTTSYCDEGYEPFVSYYILHQLHIFIFVLAASHVVYSCLTVVLALYKVYSWGKWEKEAHDAHAQEKSQEFTSSISMARQSTFVKYHGNKPLGMQILVWVSCFFKQFHVPRADYLTLRLAFVTTHNLRDNYDFHSYMIRCMEDEFETLVGISIWLWACVVLFLLFRMGETIIQAWTSSIPVVIILLIGTKLQHIMATLALDHKGVNGSLVGVLLKPRDQLFWFNRPKFLLCAIHFVLFQSAFEMAIFIWYLWQVKSDSCLWEDKKTYLFVRCGISIGTQILCSFTTLPLFALVSQMSTIPKKAFLPKHIDKSMRKWHNDAKLRLKVKVIENYKRKRGMGKSLITPLDLQMVNSQFLNDRSATPINTPIVLSMEEGPSYPSRPSSSNAGSLPPKSPLNTRHESYHAKVTDEKTVINEDQREAVNEYAHLLKPPVSFAEFRRKLSLSRRPGLTPRTPPSQPRDTDEVPNPLKHIKRSHTSHW